MCLPGGFGWMLMLDAMTARQAGILRWKSTPNVSCFYKRRGCLLTRSGFWSSHLLHCHHILPILPGWESESGAMPTRNPYSVWLLGRQVHWNVWQLQLCGNKLLCNTQTSQEGATPAELSSNQAQTQTQVQTPTHTE